ncbi:MAG TPA: DUF1015 domain-containing protein [Vicinamibacteria bacterium]|nr:DUF1015 domain-containing protein [Vicinamibacteria bacterium]
MPEVRPFAAIRYRVSDSELARVLAPPYDVIPPDYQRALYERDPRNVVRLVLNRTEGDAGYEEVGETYRRWRSEGLLAPDAEPALYLLEQSFEAEGRRLKRTGVMARFRAEDPGGSVLPHEQTRPAAREDRYRVLEATRANFSPIFLMFPDAGGRFARAADAVRADPPLAAYTDDGGVAQRMWRITEAATVAEMRDAIGSERAYIADGHHRHATALRYRDEFGPEGAWTLGYFTPLDAPGLVVLPYHRVLSEGPGPEQARRALRAHFRVREMEGATSAAREAARSSSPYAFGLAWRGHGALVAEALPEAQRLLPDTAPPSLRALDAYLLHQAVLPELLRVPASAVGYVHSLAEAEEAIGSGRSALAALLRPTPVRQVVEVAEAGQSMPAKSTFFHPKLPSGLVIHPLLA